MAGMRKQVRAFSLIELLVVIAIIAILAAIIVPVYGRTKVSALRNGDIASMNQLRTALSLYKADQGAYPPQLLGYVTLYSSGPQAGNIIPANELKGFLYPQRVDAVTSFQPAYNTFGDTAFTGLIGGNSGVVFPGGDPTTIGDAPILDLDGDGDIDADDDPLGARQAFGPADGDVCFSPLVGALAAGGRCTEIGATAVNFYRISGFDVQETRTPAGIQNELRYTRFWTNFAIGSGGGFGGGSAIDDPRQLGYENPPEDTVVTWTTAYREYDPGNIVKSGRQDIVLTLGGSARPANSPDLADFAWRQRR